MTTMTIAPALPLLPGGLSSDHYTGRADAYDDHATTTIEQLSVRAAYLIDLHPDLDYATGYAAYVKGAQLEEQKASGRIEATR